MTDLPVAPKAPVAPSAAAALIVARPTAQAPEILLLKRSPATRFMPNAYVFPRELGRWRRRYGADLWPVRGV